MSVDNNLTTDVLAHLSGRNRFIRRNMVANLPPSLTNELQNVPITAALALLEIEKAAHTIAHKIQNYHRYPKELKHILYVTRADGGTKTEKTTITSIECKNNSVSIRDELNHELSLLHITGDVSEWAFGHCTTKNKASWSNISFNCQTDDIQWDELSYFTLREQIPVKSSKSDKNKKDYEVKNAMMDDGDQRLREIFSKDVHDELIKKTLLFLEAKYKAVM